MLKRTVSLFMTPAITYLPHCKKFFSPVDPIRFQVQDRTWKDRAKEGTLLGLKIALFPWGIYEILRYAAQRLAMIPLYPAQSNFVKKREVSLQSQTLKNRRTQDAQTAAQKGLLYKEVSLEKNGTHYNGVMIGKENTIHNGHWVLQATGNGQPIEPVALEVGEAYLNGLNFNTLLVNGPNVGSSEGHAVPHSMGEAQETALRFLETTMKAKKIAIAGHSLGRAAIGQAILQHEFKPSSELEYAVVSQMAFDRTTNVVKKVVRGEFPRLKHIARKLIHWTGLEMDNVESSKKLQRLKIPEIIIQAVDPTTDKFQDDGAIPGHGTLGYRLKKEGILTNKTFIGLPNAGHNNTKAYIQATINALRHWDSR